MGGLNLNGSFSSTTYFDSAKGIQSINMIEAATKYNNTTVSVGVGNDSSYKDGRLQSSNPFFELKAKQTFGDFNFQARFRESGGTKQYRTTLGGSYALDNQNSIYGAAHLTAKDKNGNWSCNTGAWVGYSHTFKNGSQASFDAQKNIPLNGNSTNPFSFGNGDELFTFSFKIPF